MFKVLSTIISFGKIEQQQYEEKMGKKAKGTAYALSIVREPKVYSSVVYIDIPFDYPLSIPVFTLPL